MPRLQAFELVITTGARGCSGPPKYSINEDDVNTREYAKYVLREGTPLEKRELLGHLRSRLVLNDKRITLLEEQASNSHPHQ